MNLINTTYNMQNSGSNRDTPVHFAPLSLVRAGWYNYGNGDLGYKGGNGFYWESKANGTNAYNLNFNSGNLNPQNNNNKGNGFSIRCLGCFLFSPASAPPTSIIFIQKRGP